MKKIIYVPDGTNEIAALKRTTHLCIAAHQDDIELMALAPIAECFNSKDLWFCGVVTTDGAGSPRCGKYSNYTDEDIKVIRIEEQKKAAAIGKYGAQIMLGYTSEQVKDSSETDIVNDYLTILQTVKPKYVYIHNLADKHETHVATALKAVKALRKFADNEQPERVYGCEVWRDLDWLNDSEKIFLNCSGYSDLGRKLLSVFDSQISGGKRYDSAIEGRRIANATFSVSHSCDIFTDLNYAMDLTPLIKDRTLSIEDYVCGYINRFKNSVKALIKKLNK